MATPIGNLKDITLRAIEVLKNVDLIACEDTRHTKILLDCHSIKTPTTSFYQHNRFLKVDYLIKLLKEGKDIALVSDAGMPGILDPGYNLINLAIKNDIPMTVIPGPVSLINALVLSGKPAHKFFFAGFVPRKKIARRNYLLKLKKINSTIVFYESCHRILNTLKDVQEIFGEREIVVARELTKKFEELNRDSAKELLERFSISKPKGEFVIVI
ncbi:MAG: 16S rRNA (cytidine(1402)-2'-O)-methyltransferase [Candidatus Omnitrophica bacterium]|nr:16S rRNA (cytidine(1402)-2'-O)-methyltransferase [Candidatus Omnitrophota bacterium]